MTPPAEITKDGVKPYPSDGARKLNARIWFFYSVTGITPAMAMRLPNVGSQYLENFRDSQGNWFDGNKTYKVTLPPNIPAAQVLVVHRVRQSVALDARHPATLSTRGQPDLSVTRRRRPTPTDRRPCTSRQPSRPASNRGNWIQTDPKQRLVDDPAPLQPAPAVLRQELETGRDRVGEVMAARKASCGCGKLTVTCDGPDPERRSLCHCKNCQLQTGSAFAIQARFPRAQVTIAGTSTAGRFPSPVQSRSRIAPATARGPRITSARSAVRPCTTSWPPRRTSSGSESAPSPTRPSRRP